MKIGFLGLLGLLFIGPITIPDLPSEEASS